MFGRRRHPVVGPARRDWPPVVAGAWRPPGIVDRPVLAALQASMLAQGTTVALTTARNSRTYTGAAQGPQTFLRPPGGPSNPEQLATAGATLNTRNALSRNRGRPPGPTNPF